MSDTKRDSDPLRSDEPGFDTKTDRLELDLMVALAEIADLKAEVVLAEGSAHSARQQAADAVMRLEVLSSERAEFAKQLNALQSTKLFRWSGGLRKLWARLRS